MKQKKNSCVVSLLLFMCGLSMTYAKDISGKVQADIAIKKQFRVEHFKKHDMNLPQDLPESFVTEVALGDEMALIEFHKYSVRAKDHKLIAYRNGQYHVVPKVPVATYRGVLANRPDSIVTALLGEKGLSARINDDFTGHQWVIEPARKADPKAKRHEHVVYMQSDVEPLDGTCGIGMLPAAQQQSLEAAADTSPTERNELKPIDETTSEFPVVAAAASETGCTARLAQIAFDMENAVYLNYGSLAAAQARVDQIVNDLSFVFGRDALVIYELVETIIRVDEFYDYEINNTSTNLDEFQNKWETQQAGNTTTNYDFAHLITQSGSYLGLAWIGTACGSLRYAWSVDDHYVMSHEIGHNWGLGHCNDEGDCHIMCAGYGGCNGNPTFFGDAQAEYIRNVSNSYWCIEDSPGHFATPVPPRAIKDTANVDFPDSVTIDVLANDFDGN